MNKDDIKIILTDKPLDVDNAYEFVLSSDCGGNALFVGTARLKTNEKEVLHLEFESYDPMAIKELKKIAKKVISNFGCRKVAIFHRKGKVSIGEIAVVIAVSSPHRDAAFKGCRFAIDTLKETVPIWKKEFFADGSRWVSATP